MCPITGFPVDSALPMKLMHSPYVSERAMQNVLVRVYSYALPPDAKNWTRQEWCVTYTDILTQSSNVPSSGNASGTVSSKKTSGKASTRRPRKASSKDESKKEHMDLDGCSPLPVVPYHASSSAVVPYHAPPSAVVPYQAPPSDVVLYVAEDMDIDV